MPDEKDIPVVTMGTIPGFDVTEVIGDDLPIMSWVFANQAERALLIVTKKVRERAMSVSADAVVGFGASLSPMKQGFLATAYGTPVKLKTLAE